MGNSWRFPVHQASSHWASALHVLDDVAAQRLRPNVILRSAAIGACERVRPWLGRGMQIRVFYGILIIVLS